MTVPMSPNLARGLPSDCLNALYLALYLGMREDLRALVDFSDG